jgi:hypothetical protein
VLRRGEAGWPGKKNSGIIRIDKTEMNIKSLIKMLEEAGYNVEEIKKLNLKDLPPIDISVGGIRIELLPDLPGLEDFEIAYETASILKIDDLQISILSKKDLITSKQGSFRRKDRDDIDHLKN